MRGRRQAVPGLALLSVTWIGAGCGDLFTELPDDGDLLDAPLPGLTPEERSAFLRGDEQFAKSFSIAGHAGSPCMAMACSGVPGRACA